MLPHHFVNVSDIGIAPGNLPEVNSAAALAAQRVLDPNTPQRWLFGGTSPPEPYRFSETLHIIRPLWLEGVGGSWLHPGTVLQFPLGTHGLYFHYGNPTADGPRGMLSGDASGGAAANLRIRGERDSGPIAHGVVAKAPCFLSHLLIENFRGDGIHILAQLKDATPSSASGFRLDSVSASSNGRTMDIAEASRVPQLSRRGRTLTVTTVGEHGLEAEDIIWFEPDPTDKSNVKPGVVPTAHRFPRGVCTVKTIVDNRTFNCDHELELTEDQVASARSVESARNYSIVTGHGIYTHGGDVNAGNCFACDFRDNHGWGILEDSQFGNSYWGCQTHGNKLGPYRASKPGGASCFMGCYAETGQGSSQVDFPAVFMGGTHSPPVEGSGLIISQGKSTELTFRNGSGGGVTLGDRDFGATRYLRFENTVDGPTRTLDITFDKDAHYKNMLGVGMADKAAFLISGPDSVFTDMNMAVPECDLFIRQRFWLGMVRHESVVKMPASGSTPPDTWNQGDRAWNRAVSPGASEGWICTTPGTLGEYGEGLTAETDNSISIKLSADTKVLKAGMILLINETRCRILSVERSGEPTVTRLVMNVVIPGHRSGLPIVLAAPVFKEFGQISH